MPSSLATSFNDVQSGIQKIQSQPIPVSPVSLINGHPATTSFAIAERFGKRHDNVIRDIRKLITELPEKNRALNFEETFRTVAGPSNSERQEIYFIVFFDGFILLAMGYTGKQALQIKLAYIEAFNAMREQLSAPKPLPPSTITPEQCRDLHNIVDAKLSVFPKDLQRKGYAEAWSRFNRHFRIAKHQQLPEHLFSEGQTYLIGMQLQLALPAVQDDTAALEVLYDDIIKKQAEIRIWADEIDVKFKKYTGGLYQEVCKALPNRPRSIDTGLECLHNARYVGLDHITSGMEYLRSAARFALYFNKSL